MASSNTLQNLPDSFHISCKPQESSDEEDETEGSPSLKAGIANGNANSNPNAKDIDLEDEEFFDRRRISADVGSAAGVTALETGHVSLRVRGGWGVACWYIGGDMYI